MPCSGIPIMWAHRPQWNSGPTWLTILAHPAHETRDRFRRRSQSRHYAVGPSQLERAREGASDRASNGSRAQAADAAVPQVMAGHEKGILSLSWCQKDADLLLSSGKDGRTIAWNPTSGEIVAEVSVH